MAEADAYLQLLIEQIKLVESKKSAAEEDEEKQKKYTDILLQANAMLNSVKHTIVQLQIAKVPDCISLFIISHWHATGALCNICYFIIIRTQQYQWMECTEDRPILYMSRHRSLTVGVFVCSLLFS